LRELLELTAMVSPSVFVAFFLHHCMAVGAVVDYGTGGGRPDPFNSDVVFGAIMMTELGYGSSSANILTEAHYDAATDEFLLRTPCPQAVKFPSNVGAAGIDRWAVVSARLKTDGIDRGVFLFKIQLRDPAGLCPGVSIKPIPAFPQLQLDYGSTRFDDARVPHSGWLSDGATITAGGAFADPIGGPQERTRRPVGVSRFAHGSNALGLAAVARASLAIAVPYVRQRLVNNRYGARQPLIAHRNVRSPLLRAMAQAFAATAVARRVSGYCMRIPATRAGVPGLSASGKVGTP
jgi:acyl-CoA oxidase